MILIVCLDENKGMLFNRRRQSRDRAVTEDMIKISQGTVLWIAPYSAGLFKKEIPTLRIEEDYLEKAGAGEFCFAEELPECYGFAGVEKLIVYWWNRRYPSDRTFPGNWEDFILEETGDFPGTSHEKIKRENNINRKDS